VSKGVGSLHSFETIEENEADKKEVQCPNCGEVFKV